jgi:hypothetical protein
MELALERLFFLLFFFIHIESLALLQVDLKKKNAVLQVVTSVRKTNSTFLPLVIIKKKKPG